MENKKALLLSRGRTSPPGVLADVTNLLPSMEALTSPDATVQKTYSRTFTTTSIEIPAALISTASIELNHGMWQLHTYHGPTNAPPIASDPSFKPATTRQLDDRIDHVVPVKLVPWTSIYRLQQHPTNGHGLWSYEVGGARRTRQPPIRDEYRPRPPPIYSVPRPLEKWFANHGGFETDIREHPTNGADNLDMVVMVELRSL